MAYSAGRMRVFQDTTTAKENYTTETYDSMTDPLVEQLCDIFDMEVIDDLTITTAKGHRYFLGYANEDVPRLAVGWAANNTYSSQMYLCVVMMFDGQMLDSVLDQVSSSSLSDGEYRAILLYKSFGGSTYYYFFNYIKDDNFIGITGSYSDSSPSYYSPQSIKFGIFKAGNKKMFSTYYSNNYKTYDFEGTGLVTYIIQSSSIYFKRCKNKIANGDYEYIAQLKLDHGQDVNGLYIYSKSVDVNKLYNINGEYYYCLYENSYDGSYMMKVGYTPGG